MSEDEWAPIVDTILNDEDKNVDGYIDYLEFKMAQAAHNAAPPPVSP